MATAPTSAPSCFKPDSPVFGLSTDVARTLSKKCPSTKNSSYIVQDAYAAGPAWQHPHVYRITEEKTHDVNIHSRPVHSRGGFVLRDGSRLCRFRKTHRRNHIRPENKGLSAGNGPLRCTAFMRFRGPQALKDNLQDTRGLPMPLVEMEAGARCGKKGLAAGPRFPFTATPVFDCSKR